MNLTSEREVVHTRRKLERLETRYETLRRRTGGNAHVRELTLESLKKMINQFREEITRYVAHHSAGSESSRRAGGRKAKRRRTRSSLFRRGLKTAPPVQTGSRVRKADSVHDTFSTPCRHSVCLQKQLLRVM